MKRTKLLAILVIPLLFVGAVAGWGIASSGGLFAGASASAQQPTGVDILQKMRDTMKSARSVQGTVELSLTINKSGIQQLVSQYVPIMGDRMGKNMTANLPDNASATLNIWKQAPDKGRVEVVDSSVAQAKGAVAVYDGQKLYAYDAANNRLYTLSKAKIDQLRSQHPQQITPDQAFAQFTDATDITLLGTETVGGNQAYKVQMTLKAGALDKISNIPAMMKAPMAAILKDAKATLWVDSTRWVPLKLVAEQPQIGQFTYQATSMDLNKSIDPSEFVLQVPAKADVVNLDDQLGKMRGHMGGPGMMPGVPGMRGQIVTIEQARDGASKDGWRLLEPSYLPANTKLVNVISSPFGMAGMRGAGMMGGMGMMGMPGWGAHSFNGNSIASLWGGTAPNSQAAQQSAAYTLRYSSPAGQFTITESKNKLAAPFGNGQGNNSKDVTVRGVTAKAFSRANGRLASLVWQEKGNGIWVAISGDVTLNEATKIAEGLK